MTRIKRKNAAKSTSKRNFRESFFSRIKFTDSYTNLISGAVVVLIIGILFVSLAKVNREKDTSSTKDIQRAEEISDNLNMSSTYTIKPGDDLWSISENVYKNGYKWVEIAKANKIENPGLIHAGNKLIIPTATKSQTAITENNSIVGNAYTIKLGDNLWDISVRAYGDGFKWVEIANANNLANPNLIHAGNIFKIPR